MLNCNIDPSDSDTPFIWLELRRHFSEYSIQKAKVLRIMKPIATMMEISVGCMAFVVFMVFILGREGVLVVYMGIFISQVVLTALVCINEILEAMIAYQSHKD